MTLLNSTVANNSGGETASGVAYSAERGGASIVHSTVARNSPAPGLGAYDPHHRGNLVVRTSILAGATVTPRGGVADEHALRPPHGAGAHVGVGRTAPPTGRTGCA